MKRDFTQLDGQSFDLLVCGGGIYGAWVAYDAALRGLKVALVEQGDWAAGTSSASSKLIHGGLRYLETYDFRLVKKALAERQMLLEAAPHRVWPLRFGVPVYRDSRLGAFQLKAGLMLYDFLAGKPGAGMSHRRYDSAHFSGRFPFLKADGLKGGFTYADAQTDDARLVLELVDGATSSGAVCVSYCRVDRLIEEGGKATGAALQDLAGGAECRVYARQIVNTTGYWMAREQGGRCRLTKGVHLVLPGCGVNEALLLTAKADGRVFFVIPWYGRTLIGTTDTDYRGDLEHVAAAAEDIAYLLTAANDYLDTAWRPEDVIGSFAGLRALKYSDVAAPSAASRDWELEIAPNGVHYSIGGKITSAREDAASIVNSICARLGVNASCRTRGRAFPWKPEQDDHGSFPVLEEQARQSGVDQECGAWLVRRHGQRAQEVLRSIAGNPRLAIRIVPDLPFSYADLLYCAREEVVVHLDDLLRRRLPLLILARLDESEIRRLARMVAPVLGWDETAIGREVERCIRP